MRFVKAQSRDSHPKAKELGQAVLVCVCVCAEEGKKSSDYMNRGCSCHWGDGYRPNQPKFMCSHSGTVNKQGCKDRLELRYMRLF